jgi:multiple sugar transport system substrate-binding protein
MSELTRRSVLRSSLGLAAAGALARPHVANAASMTAEVWWAQGFAQEEDVAFKKLIADYEKASGNKIEDSIIPFAPLRQKEVSAITAGVVPDIMELADFSFLPLNAWDDKLIDVSDIVEPVKSQYINPALGATFTYNNVTKKRAYYAVPMKCSAVPFNIWRSLIEKAGYKLEDIPNTWDAFLDFFMPVQDKVAGNGHAQHLRLRLSADRQRGRPRRPLSSVPDGLWRQGPGHARRKIAHRGPAYSRGGDQGDRETDHPL